MVAALLAFALAACGPVPADPGGTLERVTGGTLRAGAVSSPGLIETAERVTGPLARLVERFASDRGAEVRWSSGSEEELVSGLEKGALDLVVGGITDRTPWADRVGVSRGYPQIPGSDGRAISFLVPQGENAFLTAIERFLDAEVGG